MSSDDTGKTFTAKLSPDGRIVIPVDNRTCLDLEPGNMIELEIKGIKGEDGEVITTIEDEIEAINNRIDEIVNTINPSKRKLSEGEYQIIIHSTRVKEEDIPFLIRNCDAFCTSDLVMEFIFNVQPHYLNENDELVKFMKKRFGKPFSDILKRFTDTHRLYF